MIRRAVPLLVVWIAAAAAYPLIVLAGGSPHFPDRRECIQAPHSREPVDAVFGRFRERGRANELLQRATRLGFTGLDVERDGCGDVKVVLHGIPSVAVGRDLAAEAARVGLHVTLERAAL